MVAASRQVLRDPRLPPLDAIQQKHYRAMTSLDPYLKEVFPEPPLVAFKKQKKHKRTPYKS